ncbi:hypothetical protein GH714_024009 [Hevea brasiliensis]|uniref:PPIase cyclophilin-type domain-containing protein n=1 Tax=Hevea brasiliensis TaxID=3981 RepID=A0A6A6LR14_HEVBR|nr:hypothetical protein GH714_024009 [Hevea brasiliensis]
MAKKKNPLVFMDVSVDGDPFERMVLSMMNFLGCNAFCSHKIFNYLNFSGEKGIGPESGRPLHYKGSFFHCIIKGSMAQSVTLVYAVGHRADGHDCFSCDVVLRVWWREHLRGKVSRFGSKEVDANCCFCIVITFAINTLFIIVFMGNSLLVGLMPVNIDETPRLKHDGPGLLSMSIADRDTLGSQFIITFKANHLLDRKYVAFGKLVQGDEVLKKIESVGDEEGRPLVTVKIINCGEFKEGADKKKVHKLKMGKDALSDSDSHEARKKGKHKKSSRDRKKKRRRYHSSESESSYDSDMGSSESDSDSDSYMSSSDISSSSDERRKKRKRSSKRDKYRRGKRREKRREKRQKKRDKRSRRRSRRASDSLTEDESESKSGGSSDDDDLEVQAKDRRRKDASMKNGLEHFNSLFYLLSDDTAQSPC